MPALVDRPRIPKMAWAPIFLIWFGPAWMRFAHLHPAMIISSSVIVNTGRGMRSAIRASAMDGNVGVGQSLEHLDQDPPPTAVDFFLHLLRILKWRPRAAGDHRRTRVWRVMQAEFPGSVPWC